MNEYSVMTPSADRLQATAAGLSESAESLRANLDTFLGAHTKAAAVLKDKTEFLRTKVAKFLASLRAA